MDEKEMQALINAGDAIDKGEAAYTEAAANGTLDARGVIVAPDPNAKAMEWMFVPEIIAYVATALMPECAPAYTDESKMRLAQAFVPVAEKYGWEGMGNSPELLLGLAGFGFAMPAVMAYRARKEKALDKGEGADDGRTEQSTD